MTGRKRNGICSLDGDKSVMVEQSKRKKLNRISRKRMEEAHLGPKTFFFFFFFKRSVTEGQNFA